MKKMTMKLLCYVLLVLCLLVSMPKSVESKKSSIDNKSDAATTTTVDGNDIGGETNNNVIVEENPDYDPDGDSDSDNESEDDDDVMIAGSPPAKKDSKESIAFALRKTRKNTSKSIKFIKKYRSEITLGLTVFAFRREIRETIAHILRKTFVDPKTGKISLTRIHPTSILKLVLFIDFMRRLQGKSRAGPTDDSTRNIVAMFGKTNPILASTLNKLLNLPMYNPAFIPSIQQHYTFERINERYIKDGLALHKAIHANQDNGGVLKWPTSDISLSQPVSSSSSSSSKITNINDGATRSSSTSSSSAYDDDIVIILDLAKLDSSVSNIDQLRDQISFLLSQYRSVATTVGKSTMDVTDNSTATTATAVDSNKDKELKTIEVVCLLESPGGSAADYGLAAQQLLRLRNTPGIKLTVCVDKVAASGGYMLACTAETLLAAPFAVVGSIGVLGQIVNIHELLEGWGISPLVFRGGKDKAPLGVIGEVTTEGKAKVQSMIDDTHRAFRRHVQQSRPMLKISKVGNGDVWLGQDALELGLIDRVATSDEYISERIMSGARVLRMLKCQKLRFPFGRHHETVSIGTTQQQQQQSSLFSGTSSSSFGEHVGRLLQKVSDNLLGGSSRSQPSMPEAKLVAPLVDSSKMGVQ